MNTSENLVIKCADRSKLILKQISPKIINASQFSTEIESEILI